MPWYVIYTKPNNEKKISQKLIELNINAYCPLIEEYRQWSDRKKRIQRPLFKSYIFVLLTDYSAESARVLSIPGVVRFIWWLGKPGLVKEKEIEQIKNFLKEHKNSRIFVETNVSKGDSVDIKTGPLTGLSGKFVSFRGKKIVLELDALRCRLVALAEVSNSCNDTEA